MIVAIPLSPRRTDYVKKILSGILLLCPLATVWAQDIKPFDAKTGLWESSMTQEITGMPAMPAMPAIPEEALAKMPPAQRAQMEAMMKGRGSAGSPRTMTNKYCITRESLNRSMYASTEKSCTTKLVSSTSTTQQIHVECSPGGNKMTGDLTIERVDAEHVKGTMVMKGMGGDSGRSMDAKMTMNNKWLSNDCGDVKPVGEK